MAMRRRRRAVALLAAMLAAAALPCWRHRSNPFDIENLDNEDARGLP
jgi:hypothetical protein